MIRKKIYLGFIALLLFQMQSFAQWAGKSALPGVSRTESSSFVIGNKLYVIGGLSSSLNPLNDFWEYNMATDTWTQKANFPGPARFSAVSFAVGNRGYYGTGDTGAGFLEDMWMYDQ